LFLVRILMDDDTCAGIRSVLRVACVIHPPDGAAQHVTAWVDRLPDDHPDDADRGLETFRLSIRVDDQLEQQEWVLPSVGFARDRVARRLHEILNQVDYGSAETALAVVEIIEDTHRIIEHHFCHCRYCGSIFLERFGYLGTAIKKCKCGRLTVCCDEAGRPR